MVQCTCRCLGVKLTSTYLETQNIIQWMDAQVCGGEVGQRTTESGKGVLTAQLPLVFCYVF